MSEDKDSVLPAESNHAQSDSSQKGSVVDMMLGKSSEKVIDSETMIQETQKRIWSSLKKGIEYDATVDRSEAYLRKLGLVVISTLTLPTYWTMDQKFETPYVFTKKG